MRRLFAHLSALLGLSALLFTLTVPGASATVGWCRSDPVVMIDGKVAHVWVSSTNAMRDAATGPIRVVITVPVGVSTRLLATDRGFGYGYEVTFQESEQLGTKNGPRVQVDVYAPATDSSLPVVVDFIPRNSDLAPASASGTANAWVSLTTR
jgi:hypothetical protein